MSVWDVRAGERWGCMHREVIDWQGANLYCIACSNLGGAFTEFTAPINITLFYGSSCANNGKGALDTPETLPHLRGIRKAG